MFPAGRARIAAILVVTAETVFMAVILIVEDDGFLRDDAETMIQGWGYDILSASDVDEALPISISRKPCMAAMRSPTRPSSSG